MLIDLKTVDSLVDDERELILGLGLQLNANSISQAKVSSIPQVHLNIDFPEPSHGKCLNFKSTVNEPAF